MKRLERARTNYKGCESLIFENFVITEKFQIKKLYLVQPEVITKNNLPDWLKGMPTFSDAKLKNYQQFVTIEDVQCMPLMKLIEKISCTLLTSSRSTQKDTTTKFSNNWTSINLNPL